LKVNRNSLHNISNKNPKKESIKESNGSSSSNITGLRKNMYPTSMMRQSRSNSFNKSTLQTKNNKKNSKSSIYSDISTTNIKNGIKPSWNHSSNTYDSIKAKVMNDFNEFYRKPRSSVKGTSTYKMTNPISNVQAKVDSNNG